MEIADSFVPTAGVVGIFPLVTYFFLIVATYLFLGNFIFALASRTTTQPEQVQNRFQNLSPILTAIISAVAGLSYYFIQGYYHDMLAELVTVTNANDRQVLIRESYNAIGQYRYMDWAVTIPLLLIQVVFTLKIQPSERRRPLVTLLVASFFMILTGYIGHQQLAFDNEIEIGPKLIWGAISMIGYAIILLTLSRLWKQVVNQVQPDEQRTYRLMAFVMGAFGITYPIGYILTVSNIDFNWIHIAYTIADITTKAGLGLLVYFASTKPVENKS
ncbi:bacteriorhodopsin [Spirosoma flavum]|uniref:Bacteriorhodopsin n=1 Tax=Spirosoma flavum TaxID=2048557 RepID=A0ABW6ADJ1_9BACT